MGEHLFWGVVMLAGVPEWLGIGLLGGVGLVAGAVLTTRPANCSLCLDVLPGDTDE